MGNQLCVVADAPRQYQALLEVSQSVASHRDLAALFRDLVERLPRVVSFDSLWLVLHDPARNRMRLHVLEGPARAGRRGKRVADRKAHGGIAQRAGVEHAGAAGGFQSGGRPALSQAFQLLMDNGVQFVLHSAADHGAPAFGRGGFWLCPAAQLFRGGCRVSGAKCPAKSPWRWTMFWRTRKLANCRPHWPRNATASGCCWT